MRRKKKPLFKVSIEKEWGDHVTTRYFMTLEGAKKFARKNQKLQSVSQGQGTIAFISKKSGTTWKPLNTQPQLW